MPGKLIEALNTLARLRGLKSVEIVLAEHAWRHKTVIRLPYWRRD
jgi:hypothetical protein